MYCLALCKTRNEAVGGLFWNELRLCQKIKNYWEHLSGMGEALEGKEVWKEAGTHHGRDCTSPACQ